MHEVQAITLEQDCFGCSSGSRFHLQSDGQVVFTIVGKARHGSTDQISQARLAAGDFEGLRRLLQEQDFFKLPERVEEDELQDGAWIQLTVSGPAVDKQVWRRSEQAPAALQKIVAELDRLKAELKLQPLAR